MTRPNACARLLVAAALLVVPRVVAAAPPVVAEDVPVPGGTAALAHAIGLEPVPDAARFVAELVRFIAIESPQDRANVDSKSRRLFAYLKAIDREDPAGMERTADRVPMPLPAVIWSQSVFQKPVAAGGLFAAVISDPAAALLAYGLAALDDETLQFLANHPSVITRLYRHDAAAFAAFAEHLRIHANRVVPPGGDLAVPLWEALLGERAAQPDRFVVKLFAMNKGRVAYLYDVIGHLDASRASFALGLWIDDARMREERFAGLASVATSSVRQWSVAQGPFRRPRHDLQAMFSRVHADATGRPGFPAGRAIWARAFEGGELTDTSEVELNRDEGTLIDAAWLAQAIVSAELRARSERLDQFAFGQRAFAAADPAAWPDVLVALRAFPRFRMLMLTLERTGIARPSTYAAFARHAQRLSGLDGERGHVALAQFQSAIALVARLVRVRTIERATAEALLSTLAAVPLNEDGRYAGALAVWLQTQLRPRLPSGNVMEDVLLQALAGSPGVLPASPVLWEGQQYRFDVVASEARRIRRVRARQGSDSIDLALDLQAIAETLAADPKPFNSMLATPLFVLVDRVLAEALMSLNYAVELGDAEGAARRAGAVARRHDFGLAKENRDTRARTAWALPRQVFDSGVPWHVEGAALGLDVAFATLALRRLSGDPPAFAPVIGWSERETFAVSLASINPFTLKDADGDAIGEAVARGRQRVKGLACGEGDASALAREIAMDGRRVRALRWMVDHDPLRVESLFSLAELLVLGGGRDVDLMPWGMSALVSVGCLCAQPAPPGVWTALVGRSELGLMASAVSDLNLRVAVMLREMQLPAPLARSVLAFAVQDFLDRVKPTDPDDWLTLVRAAQDVSRERMEDYVAAATAGGPLMPVTDSAGGRP